MITVYRSGRKWAAPWEDAFIQGLKKTGERFQTKPVGDWEVSDLAVLWAHRYKDLFEMQLNAGKDYLIMELGYVGDRLKWTSLGLNGLNGRATFPTCDNGERWEQYFGHMIQPWGVGEYALVCGQVPGDESIKGLKGGIDQWARVQCDRLKDEGYRVRYRPHPRNYEGYHPYGTEYSRVPLQDDLNNAALVVTYNSNSAVESVLAGVPTVTMDAGSMAWDVSSHDLDEPLYIGDREQWAHQLAWCQWSHDEISKGIAWDSIKALLNS